VTRARKHAVLHLEREGYLLPGQVQAILVEGVIEQYLELPMLRLDSISNTSTRVYWRDLNRDKRAMQDRVSKELRRHLTRPRRPCIVTMVREAPRRLDKRDNLNGAFKYVRDTIARWAHGLAETVIARDKQGRPRLTKKGRVKLTRPHAPDGPDDGIEWAYAQVKAREPKFYALHVIISRKES